MKLEQFLRFKVKNQEESVSLKTSYLKCGNLLMTEIKKVIFCHAEYTTM